MLQVIKNNKGAALVAVVISIVVLMILGTASLQSGLADTTFSINNEKEIQAEFIAKSGAEITAKYIFDNPTTTLTSFNDTVGMGNYYAIVTKPSSSSLKIVSTGTVGSFSKKVSLVLSGSTYQNLFTGIRQTGTDDLDLSAMNIEHGSGVDVSVEANVATLGQITLSASDAADPNIKKALNTDLPQPFILPNTAGYQTTVPALVSGTRTFIGNYDFTTTPMTLATSNNESFVFDTQGHDQHIIVNTMSFKGPDATITIQGGGNVHLYVLDWGEIQNPINVNMANPGTLFIYIANGKSLAISANGAINAYIYAPEATVEIQSAQTIINGAIIGEIINRGNVNGAKGTLYYVPLANNPGDTAISPSYKKTMYLK